MIRLTHNSGERGHFSDPVLIDPNEIAGVESKQCKWTTNRSILILKSGREISVCESVFEIESIIKAEKDKALLNSNTLPENS